MYLFFYLFQKISAYSLVSSEIISHSYHSRSCESFSFLIERPVLSPVF